MRVPQDVRDVIDALERAGYEAYVVGGAVRDLLMGTEPLDYDIATNAKPEEVVRLFRNLGWTVVPKGIQYGVVSVVHPITHREVEIASYRSEYYPLDYSRKNVRVSYASTIEEDLARRDFTINAMAYHPERGLVDPFKGLLDLRRGVVRFVGEPIERIREDPLRMLRAIRFAAKYGFQLEPRSLEAIRLEAPKLRFISRERIGEEVVKAMKGVEPQVFPLLLYETGLYAVVLPELGEMAVVRHDYRYGHHGETVLEHTVEVMERLKNVTSSYRLRLAAMLHDIGKPATVKAEAGKIVFPGHAEVGAAIAERRMLETWRRPRIEASYVRGIVASHMTPLVMSQSLPMEELARRLAARYADISIDLALHAYADTGEEYWLDVAERIRAYRRAHPKPIVTGHDILALGVKPGPIVGALKRLAYELQLKGLSKEKILEVLRGELKKLRG